MLQSVKLNRLYKSFLTKLHKSRSYYNGKTSIRRKTEQVTDRIKLEPFKTKVNKSHWFLLLGLFSVYCKTKRVLSFLIPFLLDVFYTRGAICLWVAKPNLIITIVNYLCKPKKVHSKIRSKLNKSILSEQKLTSPKIFVE